MIYQMQQVNSTTGKAYLVSQRNIEPINEKSNPVNDFVRDVTRSFRLQKNHFWRMCNESSKHFIKTKKV